MGIVVGGCRLAPFCRAAGHDEELPDIVPVEPDREQTFAVVDPVGDMPVDIDDVLNGLCVGPVDGDSVCRQLVHALPRYILRHTGNAFHVVAHGLIYVLVISLERCAQHAEIPDDAGIPVLLEFSYHSI